MVIRATLDKSSKQEQLKLKTASELESALSTLDKKRSVWVYIGGAAFCSLVFIFLAAIQPVNPDGEKLELPPLFAFKLNVEAPKQVTKARKEEPKKTQKRRKTPKPTKVRKSHTPTQRPARSQSTMKRFVSRALPSMSLGSSSLGVPSLNAGVAGIQVNDIGQAADFAASYASVQSYNKQRDNIRKQRAGALNQRQSGAKPVKRSAVATYTPKPRYPKKAEVKQLEGYVKLRVLVSREGLVEDFEILDAQPPGIFEKSIERTIPKWRFKSAQDAKGRAIESWLTFKYNFSLEGK